MEGSNWIKSETFSASENISGNEFGYDLSFQGTVLAVGAPGIDHIEYGIDIGGVFLFEKIDGNWSSQLIRPNDLNEGDRFGHTVALLGDLLFVGSQFGEGSSINSGLVYVYQKSGPNWLLKEKIVPPPLDDCEQFSSALYAFDDLLFVGSPAGSNGMKVHAYRFTQPNLPLEFVTSININDESINFHSELELAAFPGFLAVGIPEHSLIQNDSGAIQIFSNPSWQMASNPEPPPIWVDGLRSSFEIDEDSQPHMKYQFSAISPFEDDLILWSILESNASDENFEINSTNGEFTYFIEGNFSGSHAFTVVASSNNKSISHPFVVEVNEQEDIPVLLFPNSSILNAFKDEPLEVEFVTYDADGDFVVLSLSNPAELPSGLIFESNLLSGTPNEEGSFNMNFNISDGSNSRQISIELPVYPANQPPQIEFNNELISNLQINLDEDFNLDSWVEAINSLRIYDPDDENITIKIHEPPARELSFYQIIIVNLVVLHFCIFLNSINMEMNPLF